MSFTVGAETRAPWHWAGLALIVLLFLGVSVSEGPEPSDLGAAVVFFIGPWGIGVAWRQRLARTTEAIARATRIERPSRPCGRRPPRLRNAPGSPVSCTTSCRTRSAW